MNSRPRLSVIIPTHNGAATLAACLRSLRSSSLPPHEIIVVDDASTDGSGEIASQYQCCVVRMDKNVGAARAKNRGAQCAAGDVLFFTDDDVLVHSNTLECISDAMARGNEDGVVGLLDGNIPFPDFPSNYKNLWMRYTYARLPKERIGVFYTSVAAIRRETFLQHDGFDENYAGASIAEDTEFGQRIWQAGCRLKIDPSIAVMHCKHYNWRQVLRTDLLRARALMLMRLRKWGQTFFTSVPVFYQLAVPVIFAALVALLVALFISGPLTIAGALVLLIAFYALNADWLMFLARERGLVFSLFAALFQPIDVLAVGCGMLLAVFEFARGTRY